MIIDAKNLILGRLASYSAKKALLGEQIDIVNCEKAVITGKKETIFNNFKERLHRGDTFKGPFIQRNPDKLVKRTIRGMLPYKKKKGSDALKRIKCYVGIPESFKDKKFNTIQNAGVLKMEKLKYVSVKKISQFLGKKI